MLTDIRHKAVLVLGLTLFAVAVACGDTPPLPDIEATIEARVELAKASPTIPAPAPTRKPGRPTAIPTPNIEAAVQARIEDFDEAIRLNPQEAKAYNSRGTAYQSLGMTGMAERDFQKAKELESEPQSE